MKFQEFSDYLTKIENTSGRTDMTIILAEVLNKLEGEEIRLAMYLIQGRLVPKYISLEFNISSKLLQRALEQVVIGDNVLNSEDPAKVVKTIYHKLGDTGLTAAEVFKQYSKEIKESRLNIVEVYNKLKEIAESSGKGSQDSKMQKYISLMRLLDRQSIKFATRIITGTLRLGISDKTLLDGLSWSISGDKSVRGDLDLAYGARTDSGELADIILSYRKQINRDNVIDNIKTKLREITVKPGTPLASKLVEREANSKAVWERMPNCFVQPKLDGLRGQIHFFNGTGMIFSRNMENMTEQYPEIINSLKALSAGKKVKSIILDSEIIGYNHDENKFFSYQETMQRKRKYDVVEFAKNIPVKAMCFDLLYLNGEDLTQKPIEERIELLNKLIGEKNKDKEVTALEMLETKIVSSEEELEEYYKSKVENGLEGIITKEKESTYEPGTRNFKWIKLKANSRSDLVDTIDVAILGYYIGRGDRSKFGFGAMLAGVYEPKEDKYYSIGKVGSGFTEEEMHTMLSDMNKLRTKDNTMPEKYVVDKSLYPDIWITPEIIVEIDADEITRSPNHTAAKNTKSQVKNDDSTKGLSIRFPRMKKWMRDKEYPNTTDEIIRMYELRKGSKK